MAEQLSYVLNNGYLPCLWAALESSSRAILAPRVATAGEWVDFCFVGFPASDPVSFDVTLPSGDVRRFQTIGAMRGIPYGVFDTFAGDPTGRYTVTAVEYPSLRVSFELERATQPLLSYRALGPVDDGRRFVIGTDIQVVASGARPGARVPANLYVRGADDETGRYTGSVEMVIDAQGGAVFVLTTEPDDPPGTYCLRWEGRVTSDCVELGLIELPNGLPSPTVVTIPPPTILGIP